ncbi:Uncharacterised protein [Mycobacteroides abscessus subsp. massiliense]|nr:Uncharacterised protein [Mycobacteroides abscessus subsp. massiliense]
MGARGEHPVGFRPGTSRAVRSRLPAQHLAFRYRSGTCRGGAVRGRACLAGCHAAARRCEQQSGRAGRPLRGVRLSAPHHGDRVERHPALGRVAEHSVDGYRCSRHGFRRLAPRPDVTRVLRDSGCGRAGLVAAQRYSRTPGSPPGGPPHARQLSHRHPHGLHHGAHAVGPASGRLSRRARRRRVPATRRRRRR